MELKQTILYKAHSLLQQEGIKHFTEPELAHHLGISETTFHQLFHSKEELVRQVFQFELAGRKQDHQRLFAAEPNAVLQLLSLVKLSLDELKQSQVLFLYEAQELYPATWELYWRDLAEYTHHVIYNILNAGVLSGDLRKDLNLELVVKIMLEQLNIAVNPTIFPPDRYNLAEVFRSIFLYYIRGLCTDLGMKRADHFFATLK